MRASVSSLLLLAALVACEDPEFVEATPRACTNGEDDDGDGRVDCADSDCLLAEVCENNDDRCRNGLDDDFNGLADCQEPSCLDLDSQPCATFSQPLCTYLPQSGCPTGLKCSPNQVQDQLTPTCDIIGPSLARQQCGRADGDPACAIGHVCGLDASLCLQLCLDNADCPRNSFCSLQVGATPVFGTCTFTCTPDLVSCPGDLECASLGTLGFAFDLGGGWFGCFEDAPALSAGQANVGAPCDDVFQVGSGDPSRICRPGLVCYPDDRGQTTCRDVCTFDFDTGAILEACPATRTCSPMYPLDDRPGDGFTEGLGVCL
jgi:hypothetical protein